MQSTTLRGSLTKIELDTAGASEGQGCARYHDTGAGAAWHARARLVKLLLGLAVAAGALGCQKTYYTVLESFGVEKRQLLASRVEGAKESQQEAQETFRDALERFQKTTGTSGGELQERYESLRDAYERSKRQAEEVSERIESVDEVGTALLREWEQELGEYHDKQLRRDSERKLRATRENFRELLTTMQRVERSLEPALVRLRDQVLYLKHNLNAKSLRALDEQLPELRRDVDRLANEIAVSIAAAERFIEQLS